MKSLKTKQWEMCGRSAGRHRLVGADDQTFRQKAEISL